MNVGIMTETTAERLKQIMSLKKYKQIDVLRLAQPYCEKYNIKLGKSDLSQFISGKVTPGQWKLTILGLALDVSESWLMGLNVPMSRGFSVCPVCGLGYAGELESDVLEHQGFHDKFLAARSHFGVCSPSYKWDKIKGEAAQILSRSTDNAEKMYSVQEKYDAAIKLFGAYFSRSLDANNFNLSHPPFDEYVAMLLHQSTWESSLDAEIFPMLVNEFGKAPGLPEGTTKYRIDSTTDQLEGVFPDQLARIIEIYNGMNSVGQEKMFEYAEDLRINGRYKKGFQEAPPLSGSTTEEPAAGTSSSVAEAKADAAYEKGDLSASNTAAEQGQFQPKQQKMPTPVSEDGQDDLEEFVRKHKKNLTAGQEQKILEMMQAMIESQKQPLSVSAQQRADEISPKNGHRGTP